MLEESTVVAAWLRSGVRNRAPKVAMKSVSTANFAPVFAGTPVNACPDSVAGQNDQKGVLSGPAQKSSKDPADRK